MIKIASENSCCYLARRAFISIEKKRQTKNVPAVPRRIISGLLRFARNDGRRKQKSRRDGILLTAGFNRRTDRTASPHPSRPAGTGGMGLYSLIMSYEL